MDCCITGGTIRSRQKEYGNNLMTDMESKSNFTKKHIFRSLMTIFQNGIGKRANYM